LEINLGVGKHKISELISADSRTRIIKNFYKPSYNHNIIGWFVWGVFFLLFLFIELMCLIYKFSSDISSFERKKILIPLSESNSIIYKIL
jgi:hypothetical protein